MSNVGDIKVLSIKLLMRKAEELYTLSREIGMDSGIIESVVERGVIVEPYAIVNIVKDKLGVNVLVKSRKKEIVEARQIIIYLLRKYTGLSLKNITEYVYLTDHATVIHHLNVFEGFLEHDERLQSLMQYFEEKITEYYQNKHNENVNSYNISSL